MKLDLIAILTYVLTALGAMLFVGWALPSIAGGAFYEGIAFNESPGRNASAVRSISQFAHMRQKAEDSASEMRYKQNLDSLIKARADAQL